MIWSWLPQWGRPPAPVPPVSTMHHKNGAATLSMFGRKKFGELRQRAFVMRRRLQHLGNELGWPAGLFFDPFLSRIKLWICKTRGGQSAWMQNNASSSTWKNIWTFFQVLKVCHKYLNLTSPVHHVYQGVGYWLQFAPAALWHANQAGCPLRSFVLWRLNKKLM